MNIYEFAMQMELDGEKYYRQMADHSGSPGLKKIFSMLAAEEVKHYRVAELLSRKEDNPQLAKTTILDDVRNVFTEMREVEQELQVDTTEETQNYRKARDIEEKSMRFYLDKAEQVQSEPQHSILLQLAGEEEKHLRIMENIVEFVSRPEPGNWLENAEWHHLESY